MTIVTGLIIALVFVAALTSPARAGSTVQHDAPTTRFYTPDGKSAGSATTYGNTTTFYSANGSVVGHATRDGRK